LGVVEEPATDTNPSLQSIPLKSCEAPIGVDIRLVTWDELVTLGVNVYKRPIQMGEAICLDILRIDLVAFQGANVPV
jgi:hypothetical protein